MQHEGLPCSLCLLLRLLHPSIPVFGTYILFVIGHDVEGFYMVLNSVVSITVNILYSVGKLVMGLHLNGPAVMFFARDM